MQVVADIAGISAEDLYTLNPAFHRFATDPTGPHRLLVPVDAAEGLEQTLAQLTPEQRMRVERYTVQRGDTVASIATRFDARPDMIRELNDLKPNDVPMIDSQLRVPSNAVGLPRRPRALPCCSIRPPLGCGGIIAGFALTSAWYVVATRFSASHSAWVPTFIPWPKPTAFSQAIGCTPGRSCGWVRIR